MGQPLSEHQEFATADVFERVHARFLRCFPDLVEELKGDETQQEPNTPELKVGSRAEGGVTTLDLEQFQLLQQAQRVEFKPMQGPILPPKGP